MSGLNLRGGTKYEHSNQLIKNVNFFVSHLHRVSGIGLVYLGLHELCPVLPHVQDGAPHVDIGNPRLSRDFQIPKANECASQLNASAGFNTQIYFNNCGVKKK